MKVNLKVKLNWIDNTSYDENDGPPYSCLLSWPTGFTLRTYTYNNEQLWRFTPKNAQKNNSAN